MQPPALPKDDTSFLLELHWAGACPQSPEGSACKLDALEKCRILSSLQMVICTAKKLYTRACSLRKRQTSASRLPGRSSSLRRAGRCRCMHAAHHKLRMHIRCKFQGSQLIPHVCCILVDAAYSRVKSLCEAQIGSEMSIPGQCIRHEQFLLSQMLTLADQFVVAHPRLVNPQPDSPLRQLASTCRYQSEKLWISIPSSLHLIDKITWELLTRLLVR